MKIKQLDSGFKGVRRKGDSKEPKTEVPLAEQTGRGHSAADDKPSTESSQGYPTPPPDRAFTSKGTTLKEGITPQYVGYVERHLGPILERMGFEGERLNTKNVNNIKGLYSEIIHAPPGNDMATAYAYLAVLLTWHGITPDPRAMDEVSKPAEPESAPKERAYYKERLAICSTCPEAYETLGRIRCGQCRCFMEIKAFLKASQCPLKKW